MTNAAQMSDTNLVAACTEHMNQLGDNAANCRNKINDIFQELGGSTLADEKAKHQENADIIRGGANLAILLSKFY